MTLDLRLGAWQDVLPGTYDPERAVVITDPPYGLDMDKGYEDTVPWAQHVRDVLAMLPAVRHVIRGPASALVLRDYPQPRRMAVECSAFRRRAAQRPGVVPYLWQGWAIYMCTGTIGRVAAAYGIDYVGSERDPRWHAEAMALSGYAQPMLVFG